MNENNIVPPSGSQDENSGQGYPRPSNPTGQSQVDNSTNAMPPRPQTTQPVQSTQPSVNAHQQATYAQHASHAAHKPPVVPVVPQQKSSAGKTFIFGFLGAALACILAFFSFNIYSSMTGGSSTNMGGTTLGASTSTDIIEPKEDETLAEMVAEKALPSIVSIDVYTTQQSMSGFGGLFGYGGDSNSGGTLVQSSLGSGVVLSEDGYIITNYHVVEGAEQLKVTIEGEEYEAEVVGTDQSSDLAVIKAKDAKGLTPIEIGSSSDLSAGEWVMTLGSPYGLEQSVATGIVSAVSRSQAVQSTNGVSLYVNLIQTDAAINQGNSGGAMVDSDGKLVGINTLITSTSGDFSGVGFAIPIDYAIGIATDIIDGKAPSHAQLGVSLSTVTSDVAKRYNLSTESGAYVSAITSGGGAEKAGIEEGDIITKFNGEAIESASDLMLAVRSVHAGDKVQVDFNRNGESKTVEVTMGSDAQ